MRMYLALAIILLISTTQAPAAELPTAPLYITTAKGMIHFVVEVATTEPQMQRGLMHRTLIPDHYGMLFDFAAPRHADMWMKDTLVSLDMIFMDTHGVITGIKENATPESTTIIPSPDNTRAVLELAGGAVKRYHIARGDKVIYAGFK